MENTQSTMPYNLPNANAVNGGAVGVGATDSTTMYSARQVEQLMKENKDKSGLVKTIAIIALSLISVTLFGLFIWALTQYLTVNDDVEARIDRAAAEARDEQAAKDEQEFAEREKYPYQTFSGPADYGQLTFEYPKTWSVYVASDATNGGNYEAYFNPVQVEPVSKNTINALRLEIRNKSFEDVAAEYQKYIDAKDSTLTVQSIMVQDTTANRYTGTIPGTSLSGIIVIIKIRDKTAVLRTDSMLFQADFDKLIETITFNA